MIKVEFLGPIGLNSMEFDVSSLDELANKLKEIDGIKEWLSNSAVAVNDKIVKDRAAPLKSGDKVSILPPVCGG